MRRLVSRTLCILALGITSLLASAAYADDIQQTPSLWQQLITWVENRIGPPPG